MKFDTELKSVREVEMAYDKKHLPDAESKLPEDWKTIDIENLNFHRERVGVSRNVGIHDLSIRISKGQRIAFIGESGSGKSTILALLRGLFAPQEKSVVRINDTATCDFETIANHVTLYLRIPKYLKVHLYNITLGLKFSEEEIKNACDAAQFSSVVSMLAHGFETNIQEKGVNLSGGQKQRLALARGILAAKSSDIVLLDEPTSSIDPRTERHIYENLFRAFEGKAIISSLHRLYLLHYFDYVYILKDGCVVDKGTFEELRKYSLVFKELWDHQVSEIKSNETTEESAAALSVVLQEAKRA